MAPAAPHPASLTRPVLLRLLDILDAASAPNAISWYASPATRPPSAPDGLDDALHSFGHSATGLVVFWSDAARIVVAPPFPVEGASARPGFDTEPLRELLLRPRTLGVALVRLGGYSVGLYRHGAWQETKTGGRFVKNRHRKGGQSQRRFERIREGQIREHFDDVAELIRLRLLPRATELDALVLGGDRHTIQALLRRAPLPPPLAAKLLPRTIDVPEPRREVLERSPTAIWSSRVLVVRDPRAAIEPPS